MSKQFATSMDGRVRYNTGNYSGIGSIEMRSVGEKVAAAFPEWTVEVDAVAHYGLGPELWYEVSGGSKTIKVFFYSVQPGLSYVPDMIEELKAKTGNLETA